MAESKKVRKNATSLVRLNAKHTEWYNIFSDVVNKE